MNISTQSQFPEISSSFFIFFDLYAEKVQTYVEKTGSKFFKLHSTCAKNPFEAKKFREENKLFCLFSDFDCKTVWLFGEIFSAWSPKLHFTCPEEYFEAKLIFG